MAAKIKQAPTDADRVFEYVAARSHLPRDQRPPATWLAETCRLERALYNFALGQTFRREKPPEAAIGFYERSLACPVTDYDRRHFNEFSGWVMHVWPDKAEEILREATKEDLAAVCLEANKLDRAQRLVEELTAKREGVAKRPWLFFLAGQVEAASGQRVVEGRLKKAQEESKSSSGYWLNRAEYFKGRKQLDKAEQAYQRRLAKAPIPPAPARDDFGPEVNGLRAKVTLAKNKFEVGEAVPATYVVKNVSKKEQTLWRSNFFNNNLIVVKDAAGKEPPLSELGRQCRRWFTPDVALSASAMNFRSRVPVGGEELAYEPAYYPKCDLTKLYDLSKLGRYTVQYIYEGKHTGAWEGQLPSNEAAFEIVGRSGPSIVFDSHPELGIPPEALTQKLKLTAQEELLAAKEWPVKLHTLTDGTIKTVRIRYFNKESWATEKEAHDYVAAFLAHKSLPVYGFQVWSQGVVVPEVECLIDFTDQHRKKLLDENKACQEGRLLLWHTECCYRDATGRWWFVNAFDHFHRSHPKGNRNLAKKPQSK